MKIRTRTRTAWVAHPQHPEVRVELESMTAAERIGFQEEIDKLEIRTPLKDPDTGEFLKMADGDFACWTRLAFPKVLYREVLTRKLKAWKGLEDEEGNAITSFEFLYPLLVERDLLVTTTEKRQKLLPDGSLGPEEDFEFRRTFAAWVLEKIRTPETFDRDPTVTASEGPLPA